MIETAQQRLVFGVLHQIVRHRHRDHGDDADGVDRDRRAHA
jgi:hypothetical protein